ncbi:cupin domain-containing protein [Singulisphaera acidiphila]|uniref:Bicupin, oxalate decarboxylase family n=1 Tax=Singulisphaera acidiphila (strain ATCC BAA-1392 / DSM 18658 / VKM B-2454 / MOB10) TaxID=886293 RepID=L0DR70_SINAD|nr:cupin domain-containing protein [Singulisphaera acidiphila]AGA31505.1 bicupin, oxalate decarboxylase family [Singulisphaera acidiphila DSM 18658]
MSDFQRRDFLAGAAAFAAATTAALVGTKRAEAGDPSFMNNVPDPLLAGEDLPTFKFALEKSTGKVIGNSYGKEATVKQLPISKGIAGVSMKLEPGAMRELHWHATAAEWAFVIEGRVRTTVIDPQGNAETNDFGPGDVWYFPRGHGHMLECLGHQPTHFILIFDNGYFSEFGTFSITDWIGHVPKPLLAKNFGLPESAFDGFPKEEVYFARGAVPPEEPASPLRGYKLPPLTHKYELLAQTPHGIFKGGREWRVDSSRFPISKTVTGVILDLDPGALRELHWHPTADEWQYIIEGKVSITLFGSGGRYRTEILEKGDVGYIPQGYGHSIENIGDTPSRTLLGFNTGTYETIDLSQWIAGNPVDVLATNFSKPASLVEKFPHHDVFIADKDGATKQPESQQP